jgi:hypothetical protein
VWPYSDPEIQVYVYGWWLWFVVCGWCWPWLRYVIYANMIYLDFVIYYYGDDFYDFDL